MGSRCRQTIGGVILVVIALCLTLSAESFRDPRFLRRCGRTSHDPEFVNGQHQHEESYGEDLSSRREDATQALKYHPDHQAQHDGAFKGFHLRHPHQTEKLKGSDQHYRSHPLTAMQKTDQPHGMSKFGWLHHFDLPEGVREEHGHQNSDRVSGETRVSEQDSMRRFHHQHSGMSFRHEDRMRRFHQQDGETTFDDLDGARELPFEDGMRFRWHHGAKHRGLLGIIFSKVRRFVQSARAFVYWWRNGRSPEGRERLDDRYDEVSHPIALHFHSSGEGNDRQNHHQGYHEYHHDLHGYHQDHHEDHQYKQWYPDNMGDLYPDHLCRLCGLIGRHERLHQSSALWKPQEHNDMTKFSGLHHPDMLEHARERGLHEHFKRHGGERIFHHQDGPKMLHDRDGFWKSHKHESMRPWHSNAAMMEHKHELMRQWHSNAAMREHKHELMRQWHSNAAMRESHWHHGMEHRGFMKALFSKVRLYVQTVRNLFSSWRRGKPMDFTHQVIKETFEATPWPVQFTVNFSTTTKFGEVSGFLAYDWVHQRQIIYHGAHSTFCINLGTENDCQMLEVPSGTYAYIPSLNTCRKIVDNVGSVPPEWTTNSEYVGTDLVPGVGECRGFAFPPTEHVYYETVDSGLPCVFVFPDASMTYYFHPETFKLGPPDTEFFDFPGSCVTVSRQIVLRKRSPKKIKPSAVEETTLKS